MGESESQIKQAMLQIRKSKEGELQYDFSGNLSVSEMNETYSALGEVDLMSKKHFIQVSEVEHMDMSFFQVLYAYVGKLKANDKEINLDFQLGDEYERLFERSGLKIAFDQLLKS